jgi:hypothetical protein
MLTIRDKQMRVLSAKVAAIFESRLRSYLESTYPGQVQALPNGGLGPFMARAFEKAASLGLRSEADVARWAEILLVHGEDFGNSARTVWARELLDEPETTPADKLSRIDSWLRAEATFRRKLEAAADGK